MIQNLSQTQLCLTITLLSTQAYILLKPMMTHKMNLVSKTDFDEFLFHAILR